MKNVEKFICKSLAVVIVGIMLFLTGCVHQEIVLSNKDDSQVFNQLQNEFKDQKTKTISDKYTLVLYEINRQEKSLLFQLYYKDDRKIVPITNLNGQPDEIREPTLLKSIIKIMFNQKEKDTVVSFENLDTDFLEKHWDKGFDYLSHLLQTSVE